MDLHPEIRSSHVKPVPHSPSLPGLRLIHLRFTVRPCWRTCCKQARDRNTSHPPRTGARCFVASDDRCEVEVPDPGSCDFPRAGRWDRPTRPGTFFSIAGHGQTKVAISFFIFGIRPAEKGSPGRVGAIFGTISWGLKM